MDWYAAKEGAQLGPLTESRLAEMLRTGELTTESPVWRDGLPDWQPLGSVLSELDPDRSAPLSGSGEAMATCSVSGKVMPESQMLFYGDAWVAPEHKDDFVQRLREGSEPAAAKPGRDGFFYRSPVSRANLAKITILVFTIANALMTLIELAAPPADPEVVSVVDLIIGVVAIALLLNLILSVVFFSLWTHRVVANAHAFGGEYNEISPGWAVGWYFIPFANLVKPYQALKQAWQTTHDDPAVPAMLPTWWGLWIASNILGNISFRLTMNDLPEAALIADLITLAVDIPLLVCVWQVITRLTKRQVQRGSVPGLPAAAGAS